MPGPHALEQRSSRVRARLGLRARAGLLAAVTAVGCSSAAETGGSGIDGEGLDASAEGPLSSAGAAEDDGDDGSGGGSAGESSGGDGTDETGDSAGGEPLPPPSDDDGKFAPCPEVAPGGWVFCEDFETITDPREVMLDYQQGGQDGTGTFTLVEGIGASGSHSMEASYTAGNEAAGWMVVSFGASPIAIDGRPSHAPGDTFQDVYWRLRMKTEPGWPSVGPGQLTRTVSFAGNDWSEAVVAHLRSAGVALAAVPVTCVSGTDVACAGYDDQTSLDELDSLVGPTPLFSEELSGQWHCIEGHLSLNTPGAADGELEFWIDDVLQASRSDLDLRGSWTDYAINALVIENLWPGGAPEPLRRWIDDVVISTEPIGCELMPADTASG
jgi:hypothetical protein